MNNEFDLKIVKILKDMEEERNSLFHPFVGSEHLLLSLLKNDEITIKLFHDYGVTYDNFREKLIGIVGKCKKNVDFNLYTPLLKRVINYAVEEAKISKEKVNTKHLVESLLEENEGVAIRILNNMDINLDDLYRSLNEKKKNSDFSVNFGKNLNASISMDEKVIGREKEISYIIETLLRKKKNNPILIGEAGVGKSAIVEQLARMINEDKVPNKLRNSNIVSLDMASIVGGTKYRGEFEEKLNKIIETSEKEGNVILFIDEIHTISNAGGAEGAIGAGDIFKPYLARGTIKVIGATTTEEYEKYIEKDKALARRFEIVTVKEPNLKETEDILNKIKLEYETFHNVYISKKNITDIIRLSDKFIINKKNPDKSIDFLDSVASYVQIKNDIIKSDLTKNEQIKELKKLKEKSVQENNYDLALEYHEKEIDLLNSINMKECKSLNKITLKDIYKVLETKTNVPCLLNKRKTKKKFSDEMSKVDIEREKIINLFNDKIENLGKLKSLYVMGDAEKIVEAFKISLNNISYIRIDGIDYKSEESIHKLIGFYQNYSNANYVFKKIRKNPYTLIYIENFELMASNNKKLFKEIIKTEIVKDDKMEDISFKNAIIIASSNAKPKKSVGFNSKTINYDDLDIKFDEIVEFQKEKIK